MTISLLGEDAFAGYRVPWNGLLEESASASFFLKWEWMYTYWRTMERRNARLLVVLCHDGAELVGIVPLYAYATTFMKVPVTKVAFLGDGVAGDYMDVIARRGLEERCCRSVLGFLREEAPVRYDLIEFDAVCSDASLFRYVAREGLGDDAISIDFRFDCPRAMLGASYAQYVERLTASTRYAIGRRERKFRRRFAETDVANLDLHRHAGLLDVLFDLHRQRWETARPGASTFDSDFRKRFNRELLARLRPGDGYFSLVSAGRKPVSIVYVFTYKRQAYFYQNGWLPELAGHGVGLIGVHNALRHASETGCESFDFLRGEEDYKYKFCGDVRRAFAIRVFGSSAPGRVIRHLVALRGRVKRRLGAWSREDAGPVGTVVAARTSVTGGPWN